MNRKLILLCAATLPLFLGAVVVQAIQYQDLQRDVAAKEREQAEWIEKNKKIFAGVTVLSSPRRIEALAEEDSGLVSVGADKTVKVQFQAENTEKKEEDNR